MKSTLLALGALTGSLLGVSQARADLVLPFVSIDLCLNGGPCQRATGSSSLSISAFGASGAVSLTPFPSL